MSVDPGSTAPSTGITEMAWVRPPAAIAPGAASVPPPAPAPAPPLTLAPPAATQGKTIGEALSGLSLASASALLGALVIAAGSVGPWLDTIVGSVNGTRGDGKLTLAAAAIVFVLTLCMAARKGGAVAPILALLAGLGAGILAVLDLNNVHDKLDGTVLAGVVSPGWGIYAVIAGAAVVVVAVVVADQQRR